MPFQASFIFNNPRFHAGMLTNQAGMSN